MDDRYLGAFLNITSHKVAGYTLKPFCLRHRLTLVAVNSPLVPGLLRPIYPHDLILAARICSIDDPFEAVSKSRITDVFRDARYKHSKKAFINQLKLWRDYIKDTAQHPLIGGKKQGGKKDRGVDWTLSVASSLIEMGFTEEQAWTMPEGRAMFYFFAKAVRMGADIDIVTTEQEDKMPDAKRLVMEAVAKANEQLKKEREKTKRNG